MTRIEGKVPARTSEVLALTTGGTHLTGTLTIPEAPWGLAVLPQPYAGAHASPRQGYLAQFLCSAGLATALVDLVGSGAAERGADVLASAPRLATRLLAWMDELRSRPALTALPAGLVAPGIAAAAAVIAAVRRPGLARAIVSYAGRPDLAHGELRTLAVPTMCIVGEDDGPVLRLNRHALGHLRCIRRLEVIAGAHHRFTEPGALAQVALRARRWLARYLDAAESAALAVRPELLPVLSRAAVIARL